MRLYELNFLVHFATTCFLVCACNTGTNAATNSTSALVTVVVTVNPSRTLPVSPYIYGINNAWTIDGLPSALTLNRLGGNRATAYNWETNASNAGSDWQYQNDNGGHNKEPGGDTANFIAKNQKNGMASVMTVQMQGWVAGDDSGPVSVADPPDTKRFKKVFYEKKSVSNEPFTLTPPVSDDYVYMDEFVWAIDQKFKGQNIFGANPSMQPVFISLDNEPELWNTTHLEIQGKKGITTDSFIARTVSLATALKKQFPDSVIFGPAHYGFMGMYNWSGELSATPS